MSEIESIIAVQQVQTTAQVKATREADPPPPVETRSVYNTVQSANNSIVKGTGVSIVI